MQGTDMHTTKHTLLYIYIKTLFKYTPTYVHSRLDNPYLYTPLLIYTPIYIYTLLHIYIKTLHNRIA